MSTESKNTVRVAVEAVPWPDSSWVDLLSALLVPLIAVMGLYIAYQQYRINEQRLRHETYDRRLAVYKAVQRYLSEILRDGQTTYERASEFYSEASEATFLFDSSVQEWIDDIFHRSVKLVHTHEQMYPRDGSSGLPVGEKRDRAAEENSQLLQWHLDQLKESKSFFAKKMGVRIP